MWFGVHGHEQMWISCHAVVACPQGIASMSQSRVFPSDFENAHKVLIVNGLRVLRRSCVRSAVALLPHVYNG